MPSVTIAGSQRRGDARGVVADVAGEQRIEPGVELGEEAHGRVPF